ncbi:MAG: hypothetical protein E6R08_00215 [Nevskiaceae bacterium]|nr:MAG: hypothetical protein E6R08_00215 [Nevskiaceae bacterium]
MSAGDEIQRAEPRVPTWRTPKPLVLGLRQEVRDPLTRLVDILGQRIRRLAVAAFRGVTDRHIGASP